ncbi:hypothetical protein BJV82DRAFT_712464 [Fennellomyces sp. T-0311]|nr:hypothetical protein BJV82DRAFT_712464 [Fennellomyces sp. T-0311]
MANIPPDQAIAPIFEGFPDATRTVTRNCVLKALTHTEYNFIQTEIRLIAEINTMRRQDCFHLVNLHIRRFLEGDFDAAPQILNQSWWTRVYKLVGIHPRAERVPAFLAQDQDLMDTFAIYQNSYYEPDSVNDGTLQATMSDNFARQAIQNIKEHIRALQKHIAKLWRAALEPRIGRFEARQAGVQLARAIVHHNPQPPAALFNLDIADDYAMLHAVFQAHLADVNLWQVYSEEINYNICYRVLRVSWWCLQAAEGLQASERWSLLPVACHQVTNFQVCTRTLCLILRRRFQNVPNTPAPNVLLQQNNWQSGNTADHMRRDLRSEPRATSPVEIRPNLYLALVNEVVNLNAATFGFSLQSDGVMAHLNFEKPGLLQIEPTPTIRAQIRRLPENMNLAEWEKGVYHLDKAPQGLDAQRLANSRAVGLGPVPQQGLWLEEMASPTRDYYARTQVFWQYKKELKNREKYGIQDEYDQIEGNSANVSTAVDYERHIRIISQIRNRMKYFNSHFKHREIRATLSSARQSVQHQLKNQLLGATPPIRQNPYALHTSYDKKDKEKDGIETNV